MQSYPRTGSPGSDSPYERVVPEGQALGGPLSDEQRAVMADTKARQAAAASDPALNGADAKRRLHGG